MKPGVLWDQQEGGNFVQDGGAECVNPCVVSPAIWMHLEFGFFLGQRPGIFILGVRERRRGVESEGWQHRGARGRKGGMYVGGQEWAVPLSPLGLLLSSLPHVFSCSSCRTPHSLSQGHTGGSLRDHCCRTGQLGQLQPATRHPRTKTGDLAGTPPSPKPSVSFPSLP